MGASTPKALIRLLGEPMLMWTLRALHEADAFTEFFVALPNGEEDAYFVLGDGSEPPRLKIITGGATRQDTVAKCLARVSTECDIVAVHDAARPLLAPSILNDVLNRARETGAAIAAVPAKDTVKLCSEDGIVTDTPDRSRVWLAQTPQCFSRELLVSAHEKARAEGFVGTDDASLVERMGAPVSVVMGSYENIKVTTPEDILVCEEILKKRRKER
jgi:2-C-methyl-D-erythritol 4-phosphate cytidylyltransferase